MAAVILGVTSVPITRNVDLLAIESECSPLAPLDHPPVVHDELFVAGVTPAIAVDAADQNLTIMIDLP